MIEILPIPAFKDNYIWLISDGRHAAVVDPGDAAPVLWQLQNSGRRLTAILNTHHHGDHTGGIEDLLCADRVEVVEVLDGLQPGIGGHGATVCVAGEVPMLSRGR